MSETRNKLTREGHEILLSEHEELSKRERPRVVKGIADAAEEGDRSENAEYIYGKKRLRELDKRLSYLARLLKNPIIVDRESLSGELVIFGSTVVIEDEDGKVKEYTIVGEGEADLKGGKISDGAPVARALLGKPVGEFVVIERPAGELEVEIVGLKFAGRDWDK
jgi:transcription elongation factor GreB